MLRKSNEKLGLSRLECLDHLRGTKPDHFRQSHELNHIDPSAAAFQPNDPGLGYSEFVSQVHLSDASFLALGNKNLDQLLVSLSAYGVHSNSVVANGI